MTNTGTFDLDSSLTVGNTGKTFDTSAGILDVASGQKLTISGGTTVFGAGTTLTGTGTVDFAGTHALTLNTDVTIATGVPTLGFSGAVTVASGDATVRTLTIGAGRSLALTGGADTVAASVNLVNAGTLTASGSTIGGALANSGTVTVQGGTASAFNGAFSNALGATLNVFGSNTALTVANGFTNSGTIVLDDQLLGAFATTLTVSAGTLANAGTFRTTDVQGGDSTLTLNAQVTNTGTLDIDSSLTISRASAAHASSGIIDIASGQTLAFTGTGTTLVNQSGGVLQGFGTLHVGGVIFTNDGAINAGTVGTVGTLAITGGFNQGTTGSLGVDIASGTSYDVLNVLGPYAIAGALNVNVLGAFDPAQGQTFTVLNYGPGTTGTFTIADNRADVDFAATYNATNLVLTASIVDQTITGTNLVDTLAGGIGNDTISGLDGNDVIAGGAGNDVLQGGLGDDLYKASAGADTISAGGGVDTLEFGLQYEVIGALFDATSGNLTITFDEETSPGVFAVHTVTVLGHGHATTPDPLSFLKFDFDRNGTLETYSLAVTYTVATNTFAAATTAATALAGTDGAETLDGNTGDDILLGNGGADVLNGNAGNDYFMAGAGMADDTINGGDGIDTVDYWESTAIAGVTVALDATGNATVTDPFGGTDTLTGIENVIGTDFADTLTGNDGANKLDGEDGNDTLSGGAGNDVLLGGDGNDALSGGTGNDTLVGGTGTDTVSFALEANAFTINLGMGTATDGTDTDTLSGIENAVGTSFADTITGGSGSNQLTGGGGNDVFKYGAIGDSGIGAGFRDVITDFNAGTGSSFADQLDLSALIQGTFSYVAANGAFANSGSTQARFNDSTKILEIDADGDAAADMEIELQNVATADLDQTDFKTAP